jgi:hypothetical protein
MIKRGRGQFSCGFEDGGPGEVRTLDLMTASQSKLGYLVDFAARLATQND